MNISPLQFLTAGSKTDPLLIMKNGEKAIKHKINTQRNSFKLNEDFNKNAASKQNIANIAYEAAIFAPVKYSNFVGFNIASQSNTLDRLEEISSPQNETNAANFKFELLAQSPPLIAQNIILTHSEPTINPNSQNKER